MTPEAGLIGARLLHYAAVLLLFGGSLFPLYALPRGAALPGALVAAMRRLGIVAALVAVISGVLWLAFTGATMTASLAGATDWATLSSIVTDMPFGRVWAARLALALVVLALAVVPRRAGLLLPLLSGALLASIALTGHAVAEEGTTRLLHVAADALHLLAAGAWLGALAPLGYLIARLPEAGETRAAMTRFAGFGSAAVAVLVLTGVVNGWLLVGTVRGLFTTPYGKLLLVKVGLFVLMLALAAHHRLRLAPALEEASGRLEAARRLRRSVVLEQALAAMVVVVVAVLGTLDPHA